MALDSKLTQNINLRANGDQLLKPLEAFGREINKTIQGLNKLSDTMTSGGHKSEDSLRRQVQLLQRLVGEANTLQNVLTSSRNRRRDGLLAGLEDQAMGRKALSASKLARELDKTKTSADALEVRLAQLYKRFNDLADAGRKVGQRDIAKALNTEQALQQVRQLEREIQKLDARTRATGGLSISGQAIRADLQRAQDTLLSRVQNGRRINWTGEITQVQLLVEKYRALAKAQTDAASTAERAQSRTRASILQNVNLSEAQLRAQLERGASRYRYSPEQARQFNGPVMGGRIDADIARMQQLQQLMSRAIDTGRSQAVIDRLAKSWANLRERISEAIAQRKAFENLPEQKMKRLNEMLFGGGGLAFASRIGGAALISTGVFATINAIQAGARHVVEFEDALARLQAIAGATDIEMQGMAKSILSIAENSRYSTLEITQAATQIAQAGFSARETSQVLGDALTLATASGSSPTEAVDTLTSALGAFQLQATESTNVVDTLVQGLNETKLTIQQVQAAIQYAGATAFENGMGFNELVAISGSLANAGIRSGSTIGTGLRQLLVDLKTPSKDFRHELEALGLTLADVDVKSLGLAQVVKNLTDAGFSAEAAYESFEVRAASSFLAFRNQIDVYDQLAQSLANTGAAAIGAERASDSLSSKWQRALNNLNALISSLSGPFLNALKTAADLVSALAWGLTSLNELTGGLAGKLLLVGAGFAVGGPWGAAVAAVLALVGELRSAAEASEELTAKTNEAQQALDSKSQTVDSVDQAIQQLIDREETLTKNSVALQTETVTLASRFEGLSSHLAGAASSYDNLLNAMLRYRGEALRGAAEAARATKIAAEDEARGYAGDIGGNNTSLGGMVRGYRRGYFTDKRLDGAVQYSQNTSRQDFSSLSVQTLTGAAIDTQAQINNLKEMRSDNHFVRNLITILQERLDLINQLKAARSKVDLADRQIGLYNERSNPAGQARDRDVLDTQRGIDRGMRENERSSGTGDRTLNSTIALAKARIEAMRKQLAGLDEQSPRHLAITSSIQQLEAQVARVTRSRAADAREKTSNDGPQDKPGSRLTAEQVGGEIRRRIPGAHISDTGRSAGRQAGYDRAAGIRRDPNSAPHVAGRALDMRPIPGMSPMEIVGILEDMGLEVTAGPVRAPGVRYVSPNHGTAPHWHFEWRGQKTRLERAAGQEAEKAKRELQQLLEQGAQTEVGTQKDRISRITNEARAGTRPVGEMSAEFTAALEAYRTARLAAFDVANPTDGVSDTMKQVIAGNRRSLEAEITQETGNFFAQFYRHIADSAQNLLQVALDAAQRTFDQAEYDAGAPEREVASQRTRLESRRNRINYGEGTRYVLDRRQEQAEIKSDQGRLVALGARATAEQAAITQYETSLASLTKGSEEHTAAVERLRDARERLNQTLREAAELQRSLNDRTGEFTAIPLRERLQGAAQAWLENSGAMDSWAKRAENAVGPLLDNLTDGMADMFTSIVTGTKSVKAALGDFLKSFATFVVQMIMRALALLVVKKILSALGVPMPTGAFEGGPVIGGKDGGTPPTVWDEKIPEPKSPFPGRFNGGPTHNLIGGGRVNYGVSNRDSALYNLAEGEHVIRSKSVREIGVDNMEQINRHGAAGLAKVAGAASGFTNIQAPRQETNVYVVQEKRTPPLGKNDILITIHEDILQGGVTKKLVKQVAQGA